MAKAGYCSKCGANTWLDKYGGCVAGHGRECITGAYEVDPRQMGAAAPAKSGNGKVVWLVALALVVPMALMMCGILVAIAVPVFSASKTNAQKRSCFANERVIEGATASYLARDGSVPPADINAVRADIVPSMIRSMPVCLGGGTYRWVAEPGTPIGGHVECSIHGSYSAPVR